MRHLYEIKHLYEKKRIVCDTDLNKFRSYKTGSISLRSLSVQAFILLYKQIINFILQTNKTHKNIDWSYLKIKRVFHGVPWRVGSLLK